MRPLILLAIAAAVVLGTLYAIWVYRGEERQFNRCAHWKMYSRPVVPQGWVVGIELERYTGPPILNPLKTWPDEPPETERLDQEGQAILRAVQFNEHKVGG